MQPARPPRAFLWIALLSLGAVGAALVSQHVFDMQPCPWCVLQRLIFVVIALVALLGMAWRATAGRVLAALLIDLLAACGVAAALWQHFVAAASESCNLTLADKIVNGLGLDGLAPEVFAARASCAEAAVRLAGVPYAFWSGALFLLLGAAAVSTLVARPRR
jgi:protein dithiol:quinone oxidoreductase